MKQKQEYGSLIGGRFSSQGKYKFRTYNPNTDSHNKVYYVDATSYEVNEACMLAGESFAHFSQTPAKVRADFLNAIVLEIESIQDKIIEQYCSETAYPKKRAENELSRTLDQLNQFSCALKNNHFKDRNHNSKNATVSNLLKVYVPIGPVAVFGASNFPLAFSTAGGDTASAFAVGCPVVVKAHPYHAGTSTLVAQAIAKAVKKTELPEGIFSHLIGSGHHVGGELVKNKHIKGVGFTGSLQAGRALFDIATKRIDPIPVFAEMGSINPVIVFPETMKENPGHIAKQIADSIMLGTGQFCTCPGLIVGIANNDFDAFVALIGSFLNTNSDGKMIHPNLKINYDQQKEALLNNKTTQCITTLKKPNDKSSAVQMLLSIKGKDFLAQPEMHHEVFGPFALAVLCKDFSQVQRVIDSLGGQLTATVFATERELIEKKPFLHLLQQKAGRLIFNGVPTGVEVSPNMQHGGPYPATTDARFTSVGLDASFRWLRPVTYQGFPEPLLPNVSS